MSKVYVKKLRNVGAIIRIRGVHLRHQRSSWPWDLLPGGDNGAMNFILDYVSDLSGGRVNV